MAYESKQIANYFIERGFEEDKTLTPLKVLKLTYLAHGWHLGLTGKPLIKEGVQAWRYGPVVEDLYQELKPYGNQPITSLITEDDMICQVPETDEDVRAILDKVWELYKDYTAIQLSKMTHAENTPWDDIMKPYKKKGRFPMWLQMDDDKIKEYYKTKLQEVSS